MLVFFTIKRTATRGRRIIVCNPEDSEKKSALGYLDSEIRSINEQRKMFHAKWGIRIHFIRSINSPVLGKLSREGCEVFHFCGHIGQIEIPFGKDSYSHAEFTRIVSTRFKPRIVVLNGCNSHRLADGFFRFGIEVLIGTTGEIVDFHAYKIASSFYRSLLGGLSIRKSMVQAGIDFQEESQDRLQVRGIPGSHVRHLEDETQGQLRAASWEIFLSPAFADSGRWSALTNYAKDWKVRYVFGFGLFITLALTLFLEPGVGASKVRYPFPRQQRNQTYPKSVGEGFLLSRMISDTVGASRDNPTHKIPLMIMPDEESSINSIIITPDEE